MPDLQFASPTRAERRKQESSRGYEIRPVRFTVKDCATILRCTKVFVYGLIKSGAVTAKGSRRKFWVTAESLQAYIDNLPDWQP